MASNKVLISSFVKLWVPDGRPLCFWVGSSSVEIWEVGAKSSSSVVSSASWFQFLESDLNNNQCWDDEDYTNLTPTPIHIVTLLQLIGTKMMEIALASWTHTCFSIWSSTFAAKHTWFFFWHQLGPPSQTPNQNVKFCSRSAFLTEKNGWIRKLNGWIRE